jgi:hypothetical protein
MQNEKTTGEIGHNIPGGELVLVLVLMFVIESKVRNQKSEIRDRRSAGRGRTGRPRQQDYWTTDNGTTTEDGDRRSAGRSAEQRGRKTTDTGEPNYGIRELAIGDSAANRLLFCCERNGNHRTNQSSSPERAGASGQVRCGKRRFMDPRIV